MYLTPSGDPGFCNTYKEYGCGIRGRFYIPIAVTGHQTIKSSCYKRKIQNETIVT